LAVKARQQDIYLQEPRWRTPTSMNTIDGM
jgi:hypothetical protein